LPFVRILSIASNRKPYPNKETLLVNVAKKPINRAGFEYGLIERVMSLGLQFYFSPVLLALHS
jgi:hypothetical protein